MWYHSCQGGVIWEHFYKIVALSRHIYLLLWGWGRFKNNTRTNTIMNYNDRIALHCKICLKVQNFIIEIKTILAPCTGINSSTLYLCCSWTWVSLTNYLLLRLWQVFFVVLSSRRFSGLEKCFLRLKLMVWHIVFKFHSQKTW